MKTPVIMTAWDRMTLALFPQWTVNRVRARAAIHIAQRHFEAASPGRRTEGWSRSAGDADIALRGAAFELRLHARDLVRNNAWAKRAQRVIANNTVGERGIMAKALGPAAAKAQEIWTNWANSTECESDGRCTFAGIQHLVMKALASDGEVLIRRRGRRPDDGLSIPLQLQVLEADFLVTAKNTLESEAGGPIIQGVEFDKLGRRAAYWIYKQHPGSGRNMEAPQRVRADQILHIFYSERPGQSRGTSWFGAAIVPLKDFDEYEDASLVRQKIAAMFAAFVSDADGLGSAVGETDPATPLQVTFEPGTMLDLPPGKQVTFPSPPTVNDTATQIQTLRRIAASLNVTYEEMTGDYSQVNFSSARMARIAHLANVHDWRWNMLIPLLCQGVWVWAMEAAQGAGEIPDGDLPWVQWTAPPLAMIEPDKEARATSSQVRNGMMTPSEMVREQGNDPDTHWQHYADDLKKLDALGIVLDCDARKTSAQGLEQPSETLDKAPEPAPAVKPPPAKARAELIAELTAALAED